MHKKLMRASGVVAVVASLSVAGCAPTYTNSKKMSREDVAVDVLDCQKAAVLRYKATRQHSKDEDSYETRQAATKKAHAAWDRCLKSRGWKKNR